MRFYDAEKGFGFLTKDEGGDVYVRSTALPSGVTTLKAGQKVEFGVVEGRKGEQALSLRVLETPPSLSKAHRKPPEQMTIIVEDLIKMLDGIGNALPPRPPSRRPDRRQGRQRAAGGRRRAGALSRHGRRRARPQPSSPTRSAPRRSTSPARRPWRPPATIGVGEHLGVEAGRRPGRAPLLRLPAPRLRGLALVGDPGAGRAGQDRRRSTRSCCCPATSRCCGRAWVPWADRIQPGDVTAGLLMPHRAGGSAAGAGLHRRRAGRRHRSGRGRRDPRRGGRAGARPRAGAVPGGSRRGRRALARRSDGGPDNEMTKQAPDVCETCGFFVRLEGWLGILFGACANTYSPVRRPRRQRRPRLRRAFRRGRGGQGRGAAGPGLGDHRLGRADLPVRLTT